MSWSSLNIRRVPMSIMFSACGGEQKKVFSNQMVKKGTHSHQALPESWLVSSWKLWKPGGLLERGLEWQLPSTDSPCQLAVVPLTTAFLLFRIIHCNFKDNRFISSSSSLGLQLLGRPLSKASRTELAANDKVTKPKQFRFRRTAFKNDVKKVEMKVNF